MAKPVYLWPHQIVEADAYATANGTSAFRIMYPRDKPKEIRSNGNAERKIRATVKYTDFQVYAKLMNSEERKWMPVNLRFMNLITGRLKKNPYGKVCFSYTVSTTFKVNRPNPETGKTEEVEEPYGRARLIISNAFTAEVKKLLADDTSNFPIINDISKIVQMLQTKYDDGGVKADIEKSKWIVRHEIAFAAEKAEGGGRSTDKKIDAKTKPQNLKIVSSTPVKSATGTAQFVDLLVNGKPICYGNIEDSIPSKSSISGFEKLNEICSSSAGISCKQVLVDILIVKKGTGVVTNPNDVFSPDELGQIITEDEDPADASQQPPGSDDADTDAAPADDEDNPETPPKLKAKLAAAAAPKKKPTSAAAAVSLVDQDDDVAEVTTSVKKASAAVPRAPKKASDDDDVAELKQHVKATAAAAPKKKVQAAGEDDEGESTPPNRTVPKKQPVAAKRNTRIESSDDDDSN